MTQPQYVTADDLSASREGPDQREDPRLDLDRVPGPDPTPILGSYGNMAKFFFDTLPCIESLARGGYGNVVSFARGMRRGLMTRKAPGAVFVFGNHLTHQILVKRADASFAETVVAAIPDDWHNAARLNGGLLWISREPHRQRRKIVTPLYHQRSIQKWCAQFEASVDKRINRFVPGEAIDVLKMTGDILVDFQNTVVLGVDAYPAELTSVGDRMVELLDIMRNPLAHVFAPLPLTPRAKMKAAADEVSNKMA